MLEALDGDECPICSLGLRGVGRYLDVLSYENVNDVPAREKLRAARGFCNAHAWHVSDNGHDGLGIAIIYRDIVNTLLGVLSAGGEAKALAARLAAQQSCPACDHAGDTSARYLSALLAHLPEPELRHKYEHSNGLCLPHLRQALMATRDGEHASLLVTVWTKRVAALRRDLLATQDEGNDELPALRALAGAPSVNTDSPEHHPDGTAPAGPGAVAELARACAEEGCPLCRVVMRDVEEYLTNLPKEVRNRRPRAQEVLEAHGLCNRHAWQLAQGQGRRDPRLWQLALAGAAEALEELASLEEPRQQGGFFARLRGSRPAVGPMLAEDLRPRALCPACRAQAETERRWGAALLAGLRQVDFTAAFARSRGVCLPHLLAALHLGPDDLAREVLVSTQVTAWQALRGELDEFIRKHDYRFATEPMGAERDSPWRAIAQVAGARWLRPPRVQGASGL